MAGREHGKGRGNAAVGSSVVAFLVAGVLFMASVVAVLVTTRTGSDSEATGDAADAAASHIQAASLADLLLDSPGYTSSGLPFGMGVTSSYDGKIAGSDSLLRLGLLDPDSPEPFMMDFAKFQNLRLAPLAPSATDQYVNYGEALRGFGLEATDTDFHIRSYPSLASTAEILADASKRDGNLRVAYIADGTSHGAGQDESSEIAPGAGLGVGTLTCTAIQKGYRIAATLTNGGQQSTAFEAIFNLRFRNTAGALVDDSYQKLNTPKLAPGESFQVFADAAKLPDRSCSSVEGDLKVYDSRNLLVEVPLPDWSAEPSPAPAATSKSLTLDTTSEVFSDNNRVVLEYDGKNLEAGDNVILTICPGIVVECRLGTDTTGLLIAEDNVPSKENRRDFEIAASLLGPDATDPAMQVTVFTARLYYNADNQDDIETDQFRATEYIVIASDPGFYLPPSAPVPVHNPGVYDSSPYVTTETRFLDQLMGKFCPVWFDSSLSPVQTPLPPAWAGGETTYAARCAFKAGHPHVGDIYPQDKQSLKKNLEERLMYPASPAHPATSPEYMAGGACPGTPNLDWTDILVVGSNVDHNKLTSGDVKDCIGNWVLGGGTLLVFGSLEMGTRWLESVFHVAIESSSTGINVPDQNHPVLNVPNDLNWPSYDHDFAWRLKVTGAFDAESAFTRVVNEDTSSDSNAVLAVSDPGGFRAGSVILTGWTPYDMDDHSTDDLAEGRMFVHNLLMMGYRDLYLDYGPSLPSKRTSDAAAPISLANVVPEIRSAQICHPEFDDPATPFCDDPIPLRFEVYVF